MQPFISHDISHDINAAWFEVTPTSCDEAVYRKRSSDGKTRVGRVHSSGGKTRVGRASSRWEGKHLSLHQTSRYPSHLASSILIPSKHLSFTRFLSSDQSTILSLRITLILQEAATQARISWSVRVVLEDSG